MTAPDPARTGGVDSGQGLQHRPIDVTQRKAAPVYFPHGYTPLAAACYLQELFEVIETVSEGEVTSNGQSIAPLAAAGRSLAHALADALDTLDLEIET